MINSNRRRLHINYDDFRACRRLVCRRNVVGGPSAFAFAHVMQVLGVSSPCKCSVQYNTIHGIYIALAGCWLLSFQGGFY